MGAVVKAAKAWPAAWVSLWVAPPCCSGRALWCCSWRLSEGNRVQNIENLGATRVWISKLCPFGLAKKGLLSFFYNAMSISEFLHWFQPMLNIFSNIFVTGAHTYIVMTHGSDFVFWTLLFH